MRNNQLSIILRSSFFLRPFPFVICLLAYWGVWDYQFQTNWDDQWVAINSYTENGLTLSNLRYILFDYYHGQYAPVNQLYYTTLYTFFGYNPIVFHTSSLIIHLINIYLVSIFIQKISINLKLASNDESCRIGWLVATIFAIHPVLVESVAWIAASKVLLFSMFFLLSLIFYIKFTEKHKMWCYSLSLTFFLLSFLAKEQAVTLPVILLLFHKLKYQKFSLTSVLPILPIIFLSLFFGYVTMTSQSQNGIGVLTSVDQYPFYQRIVFGSYALFEYLVKCFVPINLMYVYPFPNPINMPIPGRFYMYPLIILIAVAGIKDWFKLKWFAFGSSFFLINLILVLHIVPLGRFTIVADRYVYLASVGFFFLIVYSIRSINTSYPKFANLVNSSLIIYIFFLGIYTFNRSKVWYDTYTLKKEIRDIINDRSDYKELRNYIN